MKRLFSVLAGLVVASVCYAETDYIAMPIIEDLQKGVSNNNSIVDLFVKDDATIVGDASVGSLATTGKVTSYSRAAVVSPSTTAWAVDGGRVVWGDPALSKTQAFTTVFSAAPFVTVTYAAASGGIGVTNGVIQTAAPGTNFVISGMVTSFCWTAIGPK